MDPHLDMRKENGAFLELWRDPRYSSRVEMDMSGNFLICLEGVKDLSEAQEGRWEESLIAGSGPGTKPGLTPPIFHTVVRVHPMLGILCDSLGSFLSPYTHIKMLTMGNLPFSHSSSTGLSLQPDSTSKSCPYSSGATGPGPRDLLRGDRDLRLQIPKTPGQLGTGQHTGHIGRLCLQDPQPQAPMSHPLSENIHFHLHLYLLRFW